LKDKSIVQLAPIAYHRRQAPRKISQIVFPCLWSARMRTRSPDLSLSVKACTNRQAYAHLAYRPIYKHYAVIALTVYSKVGVKEKEGSKLSPPLCHWRSAFSLALIILFANLWNALHFSCERIAPRSASETLRFRPKALFSTLLSSVQEGHSVIVWCAVYCFSAM